MDTPETSPPNETEPAETPITRLRAAFERLNNQQKIALAVSLAAVIALVIWGVLMNRQPDYKTLFANLSERDGGAIITALEQLNVPYKFTDGSGAIQVPTSRVHEIRLRLASQGLPKGGSVGFEIMEGQKFGTSQFVEQVNFQRALEGELARTIQSISAVQTARVHLAIPKASAFIREEHKPTASVLLNLYPGRTLEPNQVAGISHLVSSSVPQLPLSGVSIIDQSGRLLSELKSKLTEAGLDPNQLKYVHEIQNDIVQRIEKILTPIVGAKNVHVQVAADIDFSQIEQTAEIYKPNTNPNNTSVRSQQSSETANVNQTGPGGIPGALTNQPPVPATAPLTAPAVGAPAGRAGQTLVQEPGQLSAAGVNSQIMQLGQPPFSTRQDKTINYEVDKTVRYTKQSIGAVRRVSAAVVLNYRSEADPKTGKETPIPLTEEELQQINNLVKEAMGYSQERGDTLSVANAPFTPPDTDHLNIPLWKDPEVIDFGKDLIKYLLILGAIAYILIAVVKPIVANMFPPPPVVPETPEGEEGEEGMGTSEEEDALDLIGTGLPVSPEQDQYEQKLQTVKRVAQNDPKVVANIIKDWLGTNG